jgi:hypothetical protein
LLDDLNALVEPDARGDPQHCVQYRYRAILRGWAFRPNLSGSRRNHHHHHHHRVERMRDLKKLDEAIG